MIKIVSKTISVQDLIVCTIVIDLTEIFKKYPYLTITKVNKLLKRGKCKDNQVSFQGTVQLKEGEDQEIAKLLAEARCTHDISKFYKSLVSMIINQK